MGNQDDQKSGMASLQGTSETGLLSLGESWDKRDAKENINVREKMVEMTYSLLPNTIMTGHHRKVTGAGLRAYKRRLSLGQHRNDPWDSSLKDVLEALSLGVPKRKLNTITETKSPKGYWVPSCVAMEVCTENCWQR